MTQSEKDIREKVEKALPCTGHCESSGCLDGLHFPSCAFNFREAIVALMLEQRRQLIDTPEIEDFDKAIPMEAAHQRERWGAEHDAGKNPEDWFWLVGYLAGKALTSFKSGDRDKAKHHCVSTAAALRNWHAHIRSGESEMRPGISKEKQALAAGEGNAE